jgi:uncharacterized protein (TIGR03437 family)
MRKSPFHSLTTVVAVAIVTIVISVLTRQSAIRAYQLPSNTVATVSAATFKPLVAPDSVAASFGQGLSTGTVVASTIPLPTTLLGTSVTVRDALGVSRPAPLLFVSPGQINHLIPAGTASGVATITVQSGNGQTSTGSIQVAQVAPGIFTANQSGDGVPAGSALRVRDNVQRPEPIAITVEGRIIARPLDLGPDNDRLFLVLFLTGLRNAPNTDGNNQNGSAENVRVLIGGALQTSTFAGAQGTFAGLDQVNVEIPRSLLDPTIPGSRQINLSVKVPGFADSNEVEIALAPFSIGSLAINSIESASSVLANSQIRINASGISPVAANNRVSFGEGSGDVRPGEVIAATPTQLTVVVPFGANTGRISLNSNGNTGTSERPLPVRTSLSATLRDTDGQPLSPAFGARVCFPNCSPGSQVTTVQSGGWFVLPDLPAGNRRIFVIETQSQNGTLTFNRTTVSSQVIADRDNQLPQQVYLQAISGPSATIGAPGFAPSRSNESAQVRETKLSIDDFTFSLPANAQATFPDGSRTGTVTLTPVKNSLTPVPLPPGIFSSAIVQLTPFGTRLAPGGKLTFPNRDNLLGFPLPSLYKYDTNSATFVDTGIKALPTDDRRFFSTPEGAITETSIYFIAIPQQTTTLIGRVLESDGRPVRGAIVTARGHNAVTDGNGGYTLAEIPIGEFESFSAIASEQRTQSQSGLIVTSNYLRPSGRTETVMQAVQNPTVGGVTDLPPFILPPINTNRPPTITVPQFVAIYANETQNLQVIVTELDAGQSISNVSVNGAEFAAIGNQGNGIYGLRLTPKVGDVGMRSLTVTATDSAGGTTTANISLTVYPLPFANAQMLQTAAGTPLPITLTGSDAGGLPLSFTIVTPPTRGTLTGTPPAVTYNSTGGGNDSFTFKVSNGIVESAPATVTIAVANPVPVASSLVPDSATVNSTVQLRVLGQRFVTGSVILFNGVAKQTTFVSATELTTMLSSADLAQAGTATVAVTNPAPGGGTSNQLTFTVRNPLPVLSSLLPDSTTTLNGTFQLRVIGDRFVQGAVISFNGVAKQTTFVSATEVTATINASDIAQAGIASVTVTNPAPGGGASNQLTFTIRNAEPVIGNIQPASAITLGPGFTLNISGSGFTPDSVVLWNDSPRDTQYLGPSQLRATITANDLALGGTATVKVLNPAPGGGESNSVPFTINNPVPSITQLTPDTIIRQTPPIPIVITLTGTGFVPNSQATIEGVERSTTFVSQTELKMEVLPSDQEILFIKSVRVINPSPGGGMSNDIGLSIENPIPTLTSIQPDTLTAYSNPTGLYTITGTGFTSETAFFVGAGIPRGINIINSTTATAQIFAGDAVPAGTKTVRVSNAPPGGGGSNLLQITIEVPQPDVTMINPLSTSANGGVPVFITVTGTNFIPTSKISLDGLEINTTFNNSTELIGFVHPNLLKTNGDFTLRVTNPGPNSKFDDFQFFSIIAETPLFEDRSPNSAMENSGDFTISVTGGSDYTTKTFMRWTVPMGATTPLVTTYISSSSLMAAVPGSLIANIPGLGQGSFVTRDLSLQTPAPVNGSGISTAIPFFIDGVDPAFNLTSRYPLEASPSRSRMQQGQLSDGRLITTGGDNLNVQGSSIAIMSLAEIFDPATNNWTRIANMIFPREDHSLTVLGNGLYDNHYAGEAIVIGGRGLKNIENESVLASRTVEIYDPSTNAWRRVADLEFPHIQHTATRLNDGRLLVIGGMDEKGQVNAAVELYDPNEDRWTTVASPAVARTGHRAILLDDGRVAVFGGSNQTGALTSIEIYDPQTNVWTDGGHLQEARAVLTATRLNDGRILIIGGESQGARESAEIYDPKTRLSIYMARPDRDRSGR